MVGGVRVAQSGNNTVGTGKLGNGNYPGDTAFNAAPRVEQTLTVNKANQALTLTLGSSLVKGSNAAPFADPATTTKYWTSPDPFTAWLDTNYPGLSDKTPGGDPDGDGMTNFAEYAFGLNPTTGASLNPVSPLVGKNFSYTRTSDTGLNYKVWHSVNLQDWYSDLATQDTATSLGGGVESVPVTLDDSLLAEPKLFLRVTAE